MRLRQPEPPPETEPEPAPVLQMQRRVSILNPLIEGIVSVKGTFARSDELGIARLGVMATVAVAILGTVTTLTVSIVGAVNARSQSSEEFQREQRQQAYSEFIAATDKYDEAFLETWATMSSAGTVGETPKQLKALKELQVVSNEFSSKFSLVHLIAPLETVQAAVDLSDSTNDTLRLVFEAAATGKTPELEQRFEDVSEKSVGLETDFITVARGDLD